MLKRLIVILLAISYFGISAGANIPCQLWMGPAASAHIMMPGHQCCAGMSTKEKPVRDCCKRICQELKATKLSTLNVQQQVSSTLLAVLPNKHSLQPARYLPIEDRIVVNQPPPAGRSVPLFLRLRNFRI